MSIFLLLFGSNSLKLNPKERREFTKGQQRYIQLHQATSFKCLFKAPFMDKQHTD